MSVVHVEPTDEVISVAEDGTPVTGNMILEWCEAYDRGEYPGHVVEKKKIGRPRLAGEEKTENMSFRCPESGVDLIERAAAACGQKKTVFLREAALEKAAAVLDQAS